MRTPKVVFKNAFVLALLAMIVTSTPAFAKIEVFNADFDAETMKLTVVLSHNSADFKPKFNVSFNCRPSSDDHRATIKGSKNSEMRFQIKEERKRQAPTKTARSSPVKIMKVFDLTKLQNRISNCGGSSAKVVGAESKRMAMISIPRLEKKSREQESIEKNAGGVNLEDPGLYEPLATGQGSQARFEEQTTGGQSVFSPHGEVAGEQEFPITGREDDAHPFKYNFMKSSMQTSPTYDAASGTSERIQRSR